MSKCQDDDAAEAKEGWQAGEGHIADLCGTCLQALLTEGLHKCMEQLATHVRSCLYFIACISTQGIDIALCVTSEEHAG